MSDQQLELTATWARDYSNIGWRLCPIASGSKGPDTRGWNRPESAWAGNAEGWLERVRAPGLGLCHAYSGTMALDIDQLDKAVVWFKARGIDLMAILATAGLLRIVSGRDNRAKIIWWMPDGLVLRSFKVKDGSHDVLEFRCGTEDGLTLQDVLPPSIHPETGKPYEWSPGADWSDIQIIPQPMLDVWIKEMGEREAPATTSRREGETTDESRRLLLEALDTLDPDMDRDGWLHTGMGLHDAFGGSDEGYQAWDQWSARGRKYGGDRDTWGRWRSFKDKGNRSITAGTVFDMAKRTGWVMPPGEGTITDEEFLGQVDVPIEGTSAPQLNEISTSQPLPAANKPPPTLKDDPLAAWRIRIHDLDPIPHWPTIRGLMDQMLRSMGLGEQEELLKEMKTHFARSAGARTFDKEMKLARDRLAADDKNLGIEGTALGKDIADLEARFLHVADTGDLIDTKTNLLTTEKNFNAAHRDLSVGVMEASDINPNDLTYRGMGVSPNLAVLLGRRGKRGIVDSFDFIPGMPGIIEVGHRRIYNQWDPSVIDAGVEGDVSPWLEHLKWMYGDSAEHLIQFMAFTLQVPHQKVNHMPILGGAEGIGKDFAMVPVAMALGDYHTSISITQLKADFNPYIVRKRLIGINEFSITNDRGKIDHEVLGKVKTMGANPPDKIDMNSKNRQPVPIDNGFNVYATTNDRDAMAFEGHSRRVFFPWSERQVLTPGVGMIQSVRDDWGLRWEWMLNDRGTRRDIYGQVAAPGWRNVVYHLWNKVDVSGFEAGTAPPVTAHLAEMMESAKPGLQRLLEEMIQDGHRIFSENVVLVDDIHHALKNPEMAEIDPSRWSIRGFDIRYIGKVLGHIEGWQLFDKKVRESNGKFTKIRCYVGDREMVAWTAKQMQKYLETRGQVWLKNT